MAGPMQEPANAIEYNHSGSPEGDRMAKIIYYILQNREGIERGVEESQDNGQRLQRFRLVRK